MRGSTGSYRLARCRPGPNVMRETRATTLRDLRDAVACLPRHTRVAMLEGIRRNPIIVGAYTDERGICPMLAAHRAGGRTNFIGFARAWDRFAFADARRRRRVRAATQRELRVLETYLEASLLEDECPAADLAAARAEHLALLRSRVPRERPGDPDRSRELRHRRGWRWMRVVRSLDEYERVLAALQEGASQEELAQTGVG